MKLRKQTFYSIRLSQKEAFYLKLICRHSEKVVDTITLADTKVNADTRKDIQALLANFNNQMEAAQ